MLKKSAIILFVIFLSGCSLLHDREVNSSGVGFIKPIFPDSRPMKPLAPKASDVFFSIRFLNHANEGLGVAPAFSANRLEWVYANADAQFSTIARAQFARVGGTVNANIEIGDGKGLARDFSGEPIVAPWMQSWGAKWVTTTYPATRAALFSAIGKHIASGYHSVQIDDPIFQASTAIWSGGDFSDSTVKGFSAYLNDVLSEKELKELGVEKARLQGFDFRAYLHAHDITNQKELESARELPIMRLWARYLRFTVVEFYRELRSSIASHPGASEFALSMNLGPRLPDIRFAFPVPYADYLINEVPVESVGRMALRVGLARAFGVGFVASVTPTSVEETRRTLASYYALGGNALVPWDVFMGADADGSRPRYFGSPDQYGDLFNFIRSNSSVLDGWVVPPMVALLVDIDSESEVEEAAVVAGQLLDHGITFSLIPASKEWDDLLADEFFGAKVIVLSESTESDHYYSRHLERAETVYHQAELTPELLLGLSPVKKVDGRGSLVVPHVSRASPGQGMVLHIVANYRTDAPELALEVDAVVCDYGRLASVVLIEPEENSQKSVEWERRGGRIHIRVPLKGAIYKLLHVQCE